MKSALPALICGVCLTVLANLSAAAQSATPPATVARPLAGADAAASAIRGKLPFISRAPSYNGIPFEYRLAAIAGPRGKQVIDDYIEYGFSDYGSLLLTRKEQLPTKLRTEPGPACSICAVENTTGRRNVDYYVAWLRGLNPRQRQQLNTALQK